jgi:hypothetical protein
MSSYYSLPTIHSLDSYALLFQPIVALHKACSFQRSLYCHQKLQFDEFVDFLAPRNAKALKCIVAAGEGIIGYGKGRLAEQNAHKLILGSFMKRGLRD